MGGENKNLLKKVKERPKSKKERKPQKEIVKATTFSKSPRTNKIKEQLDYRNYHPKKEIPQKTIWNPQKTRGREKEKRTPPKKKIKRQVIFPKRM